MLSQFINVASNKKEFKIAAKISQESYHQYKKVDNGREISPISRYE
jgi:hypothetical protein